MQDLCFELSVEYENLGGSGKSALARELLKHVQRRQSVHELVEICKKVRPKANWPDLTFFTNNTQSNKWAAAPLSSVLKQNSSYQPSPQAPLVFHLYGLETHPYSMVLTEDNYLDFLVQISQQRQLIPPAVARTLEDHSLLLLGYKIYDWDFRTLFRGLISSRRGSRREISVAIQLEQTEASSGAHSYLEQYFGEVEFKVFWGTPDNFLSEISAYVG